MSKKEQIALIDASFMKLERVLQSSRYSDRFLRMCAAEERDHRRYAPDGTKFGITINQTARLFYLKKVLCYLSETNTFIPKASDYFFYLPSVFAGYAIFCEADRVKLLDNFGPDDVETICALDYSELVA